VKHRGHHLQEERLFDCYLATNGGEQLDPPIAEHLIDCDECAERYAELAEFMDGLSSEAAAEADAVFSPERLRAQRLHIDRRIEHLGHPARVITFPARADAQHFGPSARRPVRRWVAGAAAAGLFIGVAAGLFFDRQTARGFARHPTATARQAVLTSPAGVLNSDRLETRIEFVRPDTVESDQAFLSEIELAGERPRILELTAVDAMTPHVREVTLR
jgi:anti-sigma factor RsiW